MKTNQNHTILHYYVLPLIGIVFRDIDKDNYIKTYVNRELTTVFIELKEHDPENYSDTFISSWIYDNRIFNIYSIPEEFLNDVSLIAQGKYSEMTTKAKNRIFKLSKLPYNKVVNGQVITSAPLLALSKAADLKKFQEERINVPMNKDAFGYPIRKVTLDNAELFDAPTEEIYL